MKTEAHRDFSRPENSIYAKRTRDRLTSLKSGFGCIFLNGTPVRALSWPELLEMRLAPTWLASLIREGLIDIRASDLYTYHPAARKSCICDLLLFFFFFFWLFWFLLPPIFWSLHWSLLFISLDGSARSFYSFSSISTFTSSAGHNGSFRQSALSIVYCRIHATPLLGANHSPALRTPL